MYYNPSIMNTYGDSVEYHRWSSDGIKREILNLEKSSKKYHLNPVFVDWCTERTKEMKAELAKRLLKGELNE